MSEEDLVIDIPADEVVGHVATTEAEKPDRKTEADPGAEDLRQQLETLTAAQKSADEARRRAEDDARSQRQAADDARKDAEKARAEVAGSQAESIDSGIAAAQSAAEAASRTLQDAYEKGDFGAVAKAQREISRAEAQLVRLEDAKADMEARRTAEPEVKPRQETQRAAPEPEDPVDRYIAQFKGQLPGKAQEWLRAHPDAVTDYRQNQRLIGANHIALADGHPAYSDAFFAVLDQQLGYAETQRTTTTKPRSRPMPAAPVRDGNGSMSPSNGQLTSTQVRLSPGEQQAATDGTITWNRNDAKSGAVKGQPIGLKEYARRKQIMTGQGVYDKSKTDQ